MRFVTTRSSTFEINGNCEIGRQEGWLQGCNFLARYAPAICDALIASRHIHI